MKFPSLCLLALFALRPMQFAQTGLEELPPDSSKAGVLVWVIGKLEAMPSITWVGTSPLHLPHTTIVCGANPKLWTVEERLAWDALVKFADEFWRLTFGGERLSLFVIHQVNDPGDGLDKVMDKSQGMRWADGKLKDWLNGKQEAGMEESLELGRYP